MKEHIKEAVKVLNEALEADPVTINALFTIRLSCNEKLADHPTIQISAYSHETGKETPGKYSLGALGLINGLFGVDKEGWGHIGAIHDVQCKTHGVIADPAKLGDPCPKCGVPLKLGKLEQFIEMESNATVK